MVKPSGWRAREFRVWGSGARVGVVFTSGVWAELKNRGEGTENKVKAHTCIAGLREVAVHLQKVVL